MYMGLVPKHLSARIREPVVVVSLASYGINVGTGPVHIDLQGPSRVVLERIPRAVQARRARTSVPAGRRG